ncbi:DUF5011 domain-containing protein, partial [Aduncisulcus paluster]
GALSKGDYKAGTVTQEGDYTVVDLSGVYDATTLGQNSAYTFQLKTTSKDPKVSDIQSVELAQKIYKSGVELSRQTILGGDVQPIDEKPVIHNTDDVKVL